MRQLSMPEAFLHGRQDILIDHSAQNLQFLVELVLEEIEIQIVGIMPERVLQLEGDLMQRGERKSKKESAEKSLRYPVGEGRHHVGSDEEVNKHQPHCHLGVRKGKGKEGHLLGLPPTSRSQIQVCDDAREHGRGAADEAIFLSMR